MNGQMDRRFDERYPTDLAARITAIENQELSASGHVSDISKSGVCLRTTLQFSSGDQVRLEIAESILYGCVAYSTPEGTLFRTGIEVYRVVLGGTNLSDILRGILKEEMPTVPGVELAEIYLG